VLPAVGEVVLIQEALTAAEADVGPLAIELVFGRLRRRMADADLCAEPQAVPPSDSALICETRILAAEAF
jgi:hypothetical protein